MGLLQCQVIAFGDFVHSGKTFVYYVNFTDVAIVPCFLDWELYLSCFFFYQIDFASPQKFLKAYQGLSIMGPTMNQLRFCEGREVFDRIMEPGFPGWEVDVGLGVWNGDP